MPPSDALLRTDSLSGTDPVLSDGSVGSAPSLGLSPGPTSGMDMNRTPDKIKQKEVRDCWLVEVKVFMAFVFYFYLFSIPAFSGCFWQFSILHQS